jgi:hypothetical protein
VGRKCLFCKTWTYVYDPVKQEVLNKIRTEYESIITQSWIAYGKGKVWIVTGAYDENLPRVFAYDAESGEKLMETEDFVNKYPELQSGIADIRMDKNPDRIVINTKDGRTGVTFVVEEDKLYASDKEYDKARQEGKDRQVTVFALGSEDSGPRKKLFKVTGPRENVKDREISESYLKDPKTLMFFTKATSEMLTPNRVYIEGMIFHQDTECCLVVHQTLAGKESDRMLTCVDISGKEKWTASQNQLFDELKVDENENPFSKIFFMKNDIAVMRSGNLVVLQLKDVGVIGFDYESGKKLWELEF